MAGSELTQAQGLQSVQDELANNNNRLITEAIMREELSNLWKSLFNKIDDEKLVNLREFNDRPYTVGECMVYNNGGGLIIYQANALVPGFPFDPLKWDELSGIGVKTFNTRTGDVISVSGDYSASQITDDSTLNKGTVKLALEYLEQLASTTAIATFFINSNNPNSGNGSISNPFQSIDLAYNTIVGTGTANDPELVPVGELATFIVQGGNYSTAKNILINRISWSFDLGADIDYTGIEALMFTNATVFGSPVGYISTYVLGEGKFTTSTGSLFKTTMGNLGNGVTLNLKGASFFSGVIDSNPHAHVLFDLDGNGNNSFGFGSSLNMPLNINTVISGLTQTLLKSGNKSLNTGRKNFNITNAFFALSNNTYEDIMSAEARCVDIWRGHISKLTNCLSGCYKADYNMTFDGNNRSVIIENCKFETTSNSNGIKSKGGIEIGADFNLDADGGGASAILLFQLLDSSIIGGEFTDQSNLISYAGLGDFEELYMSNTTISGNIDSNIKIAKSISFDGNGANPIAYTVQNNINSKVRISNLLQDVSPSIKTLGVDLDGNVFTKNDPNGVYDNTVSKFTFKIVSTVPVVSVPGGEVHFNSSNDDLYFSIIDLDGNSNHQSVIGKSDGQRNVEIVLSTGQWDQITDNVSIGTITSDDGISNPLYVLVKCDYVTGPSIFAQDDELNVSLSISKLSSLTDGNGTTANGTSVDFGGPLTQPTDVTISGGNNLNLNATAGATLTLSSENGGNLNVRLQNSAGMDVDGTEGGGIKLHSGFATGTLLDLTLSESFRVLWTRAGWYSDLHERYSQSDRFITENGVVQSSRTQSKNKITNSIDNLAGGGQTTFSMDPINSLSFTLRDTINEEGAGYAGDYSVNGIANHGDNWITSKGYVDAAILSVSLPDGDKGDITVTLSGTQWDINAGAIVTAKIADLAVTGNKILDGTISNSKLEDMVSGTIKGQDLATGAPKDLIASEVRSIINVSDGAEVNPDLVSQAEAEAGISTVERTWTSERVNQAITASNINKWISASNLSNFIFAAVDTSEVIPISNTNDGNGVILALNEFSFDTIGLYQMNAHFNVENGSNPNNSTISVFMEAFDGVSWIPQINSNRTISIDSGEIKPIDLILPINILDLSTKVRLSGNVSSLTVSLSFDNLTTPVSPSVSVSIIKQ